MSLRQIFASDAFDDLRSQHIRFLHEAASLGSLTVLLWTDEAIRRITGALPKFPEAERKYLLKAIRFVNRVELIDGSPELESLPGIPGVRPDCWVFLPGQDSAVNRSFCEKHGTECRVFSDRDLWGFPEISAAPGGASSKMTCCVEDSRLEADVTRALAAVAPKLRYGTPRRRKVRATGPAQASLPAWPGTARKKVVVTGCFDWLHSGHVKFFEEVSGYGDLYVVVGNDANVRLLKGAVHPMHAQEERRYAVGSVRFVTQALISSGQGWLDAEPEIEKLQPDIYAVNEDGDQGGKREFCARNGIDYLVLKRVPAPGLPRRSSTELRGF